VHGACQYPIPHARIISHFFLRLSL
jgi:hypothetical protein